MMYLWKKDMVSFMKDASEYGRFHAILAEKMRPFLPEGAHLCDAGCGLGYLSLALAPFCSRVTAVDRSDDALRVLRENLRRYGTENVRIVCSPIAEAVPERPYDAMVFCSFGRIDEILRVSAQQCCGTVLIAKKVRTAPRFGVQGRRLHHESAEQARAALTARGIPFEMQLHKIPLGQPFRTVDDAVRFFALYNPGCEIDRAWVEERLTRTAREDFPYYLPEQGRVALLALRAEDIPHEGGKACIF